MPIKHAEITISRNLEKETWICYYKRLLGEENIVNDNDTLIILFDDGTIIDIKSEYIDKQFETGPKSFQQNIYPIYFNKKGGNTIFLKHPIKENRINKLDFSSIFKDNKKYVGLTKVASAYNVIYNTYNDEDIFAIVKVSSNEIAPRYLLAYDDTYFERSDLIYFVSCIFKDTFA